MPAKTLPLPLFPTTQPHSLKSNSPFRYPSGKFYARRLILDMLPEHDGYCEPFAGGASIFFAKEKAQTSILNDLERAFRWYYLNRTSYSGIMRPENCYWGYGDKYSMRPENWPPHLRTVSNKLQGVELTAVDFEGVIDGLPDGYFMFIDPPYFNADQQKFYNCVFSLDHHKRLAACLERNAERLRFLLTYDDHADVRRMYRWASAMST